MIIPNALTRCNDVRFLNVFKLVTCSVSQSTSCCMLVRVAMSELWYFAAVVSEVQLGELDHLGEVVRGKDTTRHR
jgi:hypothetical protein